MAHDHRMNQVGEPHLNARARFGEGRSDLPRLQSLLTQQLESEWNYRYGDFRWGEPDRAIGKRDAFGQVGSTFTPDFERAVSARLSNYRRARNAANADNAPLSSYEQDTAKEIGARFRKREEYI